MALLVLRPMRRARRQALWVCALGLMLAAVGCGRVPASTAGWNTYTFSQGNCRVRLPVPPVQSTSDDGLETRETALYRGGLRFLRVSYEFVGNTNETYDTRFERVKNLPGVRGEFRVTPVALGPHRGAEARYEMRHEGGTNIHRHRLYDIGGTSYQVLAVYDQYEDAEQDVEAFFA